MARMMRVVGCMVVVGGSVLVGFACWKWMVVLVS